MEKKITKIVRKASIVLPCYCRFVFKLCLLLLQCFGHIWFNNKISMLTIRFFVCFFLPENVVSSRSILNDYRVKKLQ